MAAGGDWAARAREAEIAAAAAAKAVPAPASAPASAPSDDLTSYCPLVASPTTNSPTVATYAATNAAERHSK